MMLVDYSINNTVVNNRKALNKNLNKYGLHRKSREESISVLIKQKYWIDIIFRFQIPDNPLAAQHKYMQVLR